MKSWTRRQFLNHSTRALLGAGVASALPVLNAQPPGERPPRPDGIRVLNPRNRVPVGIIIDDSTCLVNTNKFAMPQFNEAFAGGNSTYHRNWKEWPDEIPDSFVRKFGEWSAAEGVKGKYSIVPYPACVGRLDRQLPGWSQKELRDSIDLVRNLMMPNWDIHPEMVTHTRVIDIRTGHPFPEFSLKFMENWEWTTGRSVDEIASYMAYALGILKEIGLPCEGVTTPGGFGTRARLQLAQAADQALRDVFKTEIPHYFRDLFDKGTESVTPRIEYARGLDGSDPRCVVSILGCTGDWTGGWDCTNPVGADRFITEDGTQGRMVEVITRGEPAMMLAHWTGVYFNGYEVGFKIFQDVVKRLKARFDNLIWMKLSELARYQACKELTLLELKPAGVRLRAPYHCPAFTFRMDRQPKGTPSIAHAGKIESLREVTRLKELDSGTWTTDGGGVTVCIRLNKGESELEFKT